MMESREELWRDYMTALRFWEKLTPEEQTVLQQGVISRTMSKGELMHRASGGCSGIVYVSKGQLRTYIVSEEGREVTLYRVRKGDICVLSASCLMDAIVFDVLIEAVEDTEILLLPSPVLNPVMEQNPYVELSLYKIMTERFSDVMWTMQQILFMGVDRRVARFLWEEAEHTGNRTLKLTHEEIARYIGSAREVVTKVLNYFVQEEAVTLGRGKVQVAEKLREYL